MLAVQHRMIVFCLGERFAKPIAGAAPAGNGIAMDAGFRGGFGERSSVGDGSDVTLLLDGQHVWQARRGDGNSGCGHLFNSGLSITGGHSGPSRESGYAVETVGNGILRFLLPVKCHTIGATRGVWVWRAGRREVNAHREPLLLTRNSAANLARRSDHYARWYRGSPVAQAAASLRIRAVPILPVCGSAPETSDDTSPSFISVRPLVHRLSSIRVDL